VLCKVENMSENPYYASHTIKSPVERKKRSLCTLNIFQIRDNVRFKILGQYANAIISYNYFAIRFVYNFIHLI
jgi:hypothetical protein